MALGKPQETKIFAELVHMSPEERAKYNISIDSYRSNLSSWKNEREEGRAEGRAEEKLENARALKANGVPVQVIATSLGLPIETIESL